MRSGADLLVLVEVRVATAGAELTRNLRVSVPLALVVNESEVPSDGMDGQEKQSDFTLL